MRCRSIALFLGAICVAIVGVNVFAQQKPRLNGHPVVLDAQGELLSWVVILAERMQRC